MRKIGCIFSVLMIVLTVFSAEKVFWHGMCFSIEKEKVNSYIKFIEELFTCKLMLNYSELFLFDESRY